MRRIIAVFSLSVALQSSALAASIQPGGAIGVTDLRQMIAKVRNSRPKDQFDTPARLPSLIGRSFDLKLPLKESGLGNNCTGDAVWGYSTEKQTLQILYGSGEIASSFPTADALLHPRARFTFSCSKANKTKLMQNGFGAVTEVDAEYQTYDAVEAENIDGGVIGRQYDIPMAGSAAREVTKSLQLRVSGVFSTGKDGQPVTCDEDLVPATRSMPDEYYRKFCTLAAHVSLVQLIDGRSGRVLGNLFEDAGAGNSTESTTQSSSSADELSKH